MSGWATLDTPCFPLPVFGPRLVRFTQGICVGGRERETERDRDTDTDTDTETETERQTERETQRE